MPFYDTNHLFRTELCNFSGSKIYPGHGKLFIRGDSKSFRLLNGKCEAHFLLKKNPRKYNWTVFYRRLHKKGVTEEVAKKRTRKTTKIQRAIVGATWEQIVAKREQPTEVRDAHRKAEKDASKAKKRAEEEKKRAEKIKNAGREQPKQKAVKNLAGNKSGSNRRY